MKISFTQEASFADFFFDFELSSDGRNVQTYKTLQHLYRKYSDINKIETIILPYSLEDNNIGYDFELFIEHVRTESNDHIADLPIIVHLSDQDMEDWINGDNRYDKVIFELIGVVLTENPSPDDLIQAQKNRDEIALDEYRARLGSKPASETGRHDISNRWGPYIVLKSLSILDSQFGQYKDEIECELNEELYYKKLIQEISGSKKHEKRLGVLKGERKKLEDQQCLCKILIVEDQLGDGWDIAYRSLLPKGRIILVAKSRDEAIEIIQEPANQDIDLILLDVRLSQNDRNFEYQDERSRSVKELSGVKLANFIRTKSAMPLRTVPIVAATASNKSWTLEALLDNGINDCWVKGDPKLFNSTELCIENTIDFYKRLNKVMDWSQQTRNWQQELYRIAKIAGSPRLSKKAKSLQALLFRSFSPFDKEVSEGLQLNLAFLEVYSCLNDLAEWVCTIEDSDDGTSKWRLQGDTRGTPLIDRKLSVTKSNGKKIFKWHIQDGDDFYASTDFPDTSVIKKILINKGLDFESFKELSKIRNGLPLIHGKENLRASGSAEEISIRTEDIDKLVSLLGELVNHHVEALKPL